MNRETIDKNEVIQLGQRVYCGLYGGKYGIVVRIHGQQAPEQIRSLGGGAVMYGSRCTLDVAFDNGGLSPYVPECIVRGVQWKIFDDVATADEILDALRHCSNSAALRKEREEADTARRAQERADHLAANPHLIPKSAQPDWGPGRLAAANLRIELKRAFPSTKFRITSDYSSVNIHWENGPTYDQVKKIGDKYRAGSFDGMTDCYEFDPDATFGDVFGDPQYVFPRREETQEGVREAFRRAGRNPDDVPQDFARNGHPDYEENRRIRSVWYECDLSDWQEEKAPAPKAAGPFWSKNGLLAKDENGWAREFRKRETIEAEAARLTELGYHVEIVSSRRARNCWFIRSLITVAE